MYISDQLQEELNFFKRMNAHFEMDAGKATCKVADASSEMLYMCFAASLVMDYSDDGLFENFVITDKSISGKQEMQIDAYAFIETDNALVKQLHVFQFKNYDSDNRSASPVELLNFATYINNNFVHPELLSHPDDNPVVKEIRSKFYSFLNARKGRRITVHCHYINNARGITKANEKQINSTVMGRFLQDKQLNGFTIQVNGIQDILDLAIDGKIHVADETLDLVIDGPTSYRLEDNTSRTSMGLPQKVIVGMCNVNEFIRLQNKYHHNQLYTENIRAYLGDRGSVNKAIISTITSDNSIWFPYMNNGISIICDKLTIGNTNPEKHKCQLTLQNMQIINGCQTVNALYSAKYKESTRDNFRASTVMVRIYEISPGQTDFKMNIIKATNNQNAVKSYSLMANDPIQKEIGKVLEKFNVLYDRKGEGKATSNKTVVNMASAALAYRAVYLRKARKLRSGLGRNRVFREKEYESVFDPTFLAAGKEEDLVKLSCKLMISSLILDRVRDLIPRYSDEYISRLPIIKKSAFYLAGYVMAISQNSFNTLLGEMVTEYTSGNMLKIKNKNYTQAINELVDTSFVQVLDVFSSFYATVTDVDKSDIDNLLKDQAFGDQYESELKRFD